MNDPHKKASRFLSLILRHKPEQIGIELDHAGWARISDLIKLANRKDLTQESIKEIVSQNAKQRFDISSNGKFIRANQGHSIDIDLQLEAVEPPQFLYHGTATHSLDSILKIGLDKRQRHHVHLTEDQELAMNVGQRYGNPVLLQIQAASMHATGTEFFCTKNNVWLCDHVPVDFIVISTF